MASFFDMGGYGSFVWPAYAIVAFVMVGLWIMSRRLQRTSSDELAALNPGTRRRQQEPNDET